MAKGSIYDLICRAVTDAAFLRLLLSNPTEATDGYTISPIEMDNLLSLTEESLEKLSIGLDQRISMTTFSQAISSTADAISGHAVIGFGTPSTDLYGIQPIPHDIHIPGSISNDFHIGMTSDAHLGGQLPSGWEAPPDGHMPPPPGGTMQGGFGAGGGLMPTDGHMNQGPGAPIPQGGFGAGVGLMPPDGHMNQGPGTPMPQGGFGTGGGLMATDGHMDQHPAAPMPQSGLGIGHGPMPTDGQHGLTPDSDGKGHGPTPNTDGKGHG
ncbi:Os1348 family NHLP clan protein [Desulfosporosinus sp. Sb-LF]|uniref:Os1348 family NHLP clan protein n=1 Tax=Desulfosporosinus sp. Sb-LF TaxID=2560027 RepID=UPI00107F19A4|nr:Os1348 family NHLP clan protein [Desulfosporosinus sp. Sb-LF]TGE30962.1 hypothetical protein E4K68_19870 [Desulfosporosinus sp. Sb-LF]